APELIVVATLLAVLTLDLFLPRATKYWVATLAVAGTALAAVPLILLAVEGSTRSMFEDSFVVDDFALALKGLLLIGAYLVLLMSVSYIESDRYYQGEYYLLLLSSLLGSMLMASGRDLIVLFIGIELTTGPLYLLTAWRKRDIRSTEASIKYFILGVLYSSTMLFGMSLIFGLTGSVGFAEIAAAYGDMTSEPAMIIAVMLLFVGFGF